MKFPSLFRAYGAKYDYLTKYIKYHKYLYFLKTKTLKSMVKITLKAATY